MDSETNDEPIDPIKADELPRTRKPPMSEIFNHDYVAICNFTLLESMGPAELVLMVGGRSYPLMTVACPVGLGGCVLIDKIHVHGWHKRPAT